MFGGMSMYRTRDFRRAERRRHINRKKRIIKDQNNYWHYEHDGVLSKGKIHCSCWLCSNKTWARGRSRSDNRKLDRLNYVD